MRLGCRPAWARRAHRHSRGRTPRRPRTTSWSRAGSWRRHGAVDGVHRSRAPADARRAARSDAEQYDAQGYPPLRRAIAKRLQARGLVVDPDEMVITTGSQQSLEIVARSLAVRRVAVESPVYA